MGAGGDDKAFFPESTGDDGESVGQGRRSSPTGMNVGGESKIEEAATKEARKKSGARRSTKKRSGSSHQAALRKTMAETPTQESYKDLTSVLNKFK